MGAALHGGAGKGTGADRAGNETNSRWNQLSRGCAQWGARWAVPRCRGGLEGRRAGEELQKRVLRAKPFPRRSERYRTLCDRTPEPIDSGVRIPHGKGPIHHESSGAGVAWAALDAAHLAGLSAVRVLRLRAHFLLQHPEPLRAALLRRTPRARVVASAPVRTSSRAGLLRDAPVARRELRDVRRPA